MQVLDVVYVKSHKKNGVIKKLYPNKTEVDVKFQDKVLPTKVKVKDCVAPTEAGINT